MLARPAIPGAGYPGVPGYELRSVGYLAFVAGMLEVAVRE
jgi:hypothetical protein